MFTLLRVRATGAYEQPLCPTLLHHLVQWCNHYLGVDMKWKDKKDSVMSRKSWVIARILSPVPCKAKLSFPLKTCKTGASKTYRICRSSFFSESNTFVHIRATRIVMMFVWIWWQGRSPGFYICLQRFYWTENTTLYHPFTTANPTPLAFIASFF